jgi:HEPN domain-containing protein
MSGAEEAGRLLDMAEKDLNALLHMGDPSAFPDEIFGFHAQQAAEKALKSWLAVLNREYPLTHDLSYLLRTLEEGGADIQRFWDLVELNAFAVQFRYEAYDEPDDPLPRDTTLTALRNLLNVVTSFLAPHGERR